MKTPTLPSALACATSAARAAGDLMRRNLHRPKRVLSASQHDIKLELDQRCQALIGRELRRGFAGAALLGEEGVLGNPEADWRWVVDPIDGTVNFTYGIPHACVSVALQERVGPEPDLAGATYADGFTTRVGVVLDPFTEELWTATSTGPARLNGRRIHVSPRTRLREAIVALGFAKRRKSLMRMLPVLERLAHRVRKIRITGAAALSLTYVATGRFDAYLESGVRLWDIAAAGLILQRSGGVFWRREVDTGRTYEIVASAAVHQPVLRRLNSIEI